MGSGRFGVYLFVLVNILLTTGQSIKDDGEAAKYLLPGNLIPFHYRLDLDTNIEQFDENSEDTFYYSGRVVIDILPIEDNITEIVLHSHLSIDIQIATLATQAGFVTALEGKKFDQETQKLSFQAPEGRIRKNEPIWIEIYFLGHHFDSSAGFYRAKTPTNTGWVWVLATQFEPVSARLAFPCFDEPKYKAKYELRVSVRTELVEQGYHVLSNTDVRETQNYINNRTYFYFEETPLPVSSYLIAVVVSDYLPTRTAQFNSTYPDPGPGPLKNFTTWGQKELIMAGNGKTAQTAGPALLEIYTQNFNIGFGYNKLDQACVTNYGGGMENWGLVIYGDFLMNDSPSSVYGNVIIIAHELGHQWFGDLVTFHWWSDVWLNEGFATYLGYHGADQIRVDGLDTSTWKLQYNFVVGVLQGAMEWDVGDDVIAMTSDVWDQRSISSRFDYVSYDKAGSVIRMWRHILGEQTFNEGLGLYLRQRRENVGTPEFLLAAFDAVANKSASDLQGQLPSELFKNWHLQPGYPVLLVNKSPKDNATYTLEQMRFGVTKSSTQADLKWNIPISFSTNRNKNFNQTHATSWLRASDSSSNITLPEPVEWIVVNNQETGYYRVRYDDENYNTLVGVISNETSREDIDEINRAQILDDASAFARSTAEYNLPYSIFFRLLGGLKTETSYFPWAAAFKNLQFLDRMLINNATTYPLFQKYVMSLLQERYDSVRIEEEPTDYLELKLRKKIVRWACKMNHDNCLEEARKLISKPAGRKSSLAAVGYCSEVKKGGKVAWKRLWQKLETTNDLSERTALVRGLGCVTDLSTAAKFMRKSIEGFNTVYAGERALILQSIYNADPLKARLVLAFLMTNLELCNESFRDSTRKGNTLLRLSGSLGTDSDVAMMDYLVEEIKGSNSLEVKAALPQALKAQKIVKANNLWIQKKSDEVYRWLKENDAKL